MTDRNECETYLEQISAMLDGELTADEQAKLDEHLKSCASCREHLEMMRYMIDVTNDTLVEAPAGLSDSVMQEIRAQGNVTPINKTSKILRFLSGRSFTLVAAAVAALVIFSPTLLNHLSGFGTANSMMNETAFQTTRAGTTKAASAYDARVLPATTAATAAAGGADAVSQHIADIASVTSAPESYTIPETGDAEYKYAQLSDIHHYNQLDHLPDFSACEEPYSSVILLDTNQLQEQTKLPDFPTEVLPELTECDGFSYAILTDDQVQDVLAVTADGTSSHDQISFHVLDDVSLYPALDPDSRNTLFVMIDLSKE